MKYRLKTAELTDPNDIDLPKGIIVLNSYRKIKMHPGPMIYLITYLEPVQ